MVKTNLELDLENERSYLLDGVEDGRYSENVVLVPGNDLLDLLFDVLDGHLVLLLAERDELLIRHFAHFVISKAFDHGVQNLVNGSVDSSAAISYLFHGGDDHIFQSHVLLVRGLLGIDETVSITKNLEVFAQRLAYLCGKSLGKLDALSL